MWVNRWSSFYFKFDFSFIHSFLLTVASTTTRESKGAISQIQISTHPTPPTFDTWNVGQFLIESLKKSHPPLSQSDANPKSDATWSSGYPRASWSLLLFYTFSSHKLIIFSLLWLPFVMTLALILRRRIEKYSKAKLRLWGNGKDSNTLYWRKNNISKELPSTCGKYDLCASLTEGSRLEF